MLWKMIDTKDSDENGHFILIRMNYSMASLAKQYRDHIIKLHGTPRKIVLDKDPRFVVILEGIPERTWHWHKSSSYQTNGQSRRTIQMFLVDLFTSCILDFSGLCNDHLLLVDFAYSSCHASIGIALFEALYNSSCKSPTYLLVGGQQLIAGPKILQVQQCVVETIRHHLR